MRIVYFGTAEFAVPALKAVASHVALVVTQPDRPSGRGMKLKPSPTKQSAQELGLPVVSPEKCRNPEFVSEVLAMEADFLLVAAYGQILPQALLDAGRHGAINLHGSILPKYRGAAPIQRAIEAGETETGVTLMQMDRGMDTGAMIADIRTKIGPNETYGELAQRLGVLAANLAKNWMVRLASGDYPRSPQDDSQASHAPKVAKHEAQLRFENPAELEYRKFRAFSPSPGPYIATSLGILRLRRVGIDMNESGQTGEILSIQPLTVAFSMGSLIFESVQAEGRSPVDGRDWANGQRLKPGMKLRPQ